MALYNPILKKIGTDKKKDDKDPKIKSILDFLNPEIMDKIDEKYDGNKVGGYIAETFKDLAGNEFAEAFKDPLSKESLDLLYKPAFNHIGYVFETMDRIVRPVRGLATELGNKSKGKDYDLSFDNLVTKSLSGQKEFSGQEVVGAWKDKDPQDVNFWGGLLVEILLDPTTYTGVGLATKLGKTGKVGKAVSKPLDALEKMDSTLFKASGLPLAGKQLKKLWKGKDFVSPRVLDDVMNKVGKDLDNNVDIMGNYNKLFGEGKITLEHKEFFDKLHAKGITNDQLKEMQTFVREFEETASKVRQFALNNKLTKKDVEKLSPEIKRTFGELVQKYEKHIDELAELDPRFALLKGFSDEVKNARVLKEAELKQGVKKYESTNRRLNKRIDKVKAERKIYNAKGSKIKEDLAQVEVEYGAKMKEVRNTRDMSLENLRKQKQTKLAELRQAREVALKEVQELKAKTQVDLANRKARELQRLDDQIKALDNIRDEEIAEVLKNIESMKQNVLMDSVVHTTPSGQAQFDFAKETKPKPTKKKLSGVDKSTTSYKAFLGSDEFQHLTKTGERTLDDIPAMKQINKQIEQTEKTITDFNKKLEALEDIKKIDELILKTPDNIGKKYEAIGKGIGDKSKVVEDTYSKLDKKLNTKYKNVLEQTKDVYRAEIETNEVLYQQLTKQTMDNISKNIKLIAQEKQLQKELIQQGYSDMRTKLDKKLKSIKQKIKENTLPNGVTIKNDAQNELASVMYDFDLTLKPDELERIAYSIPVDNIGDYINVALPSDPIGLGNKLTNIVRKFKFDIHHVTDFHKKQHKELKKLISKIAGSKEEYEKVSKMLIDDVEKEFYSRHSFKFGEAFQDFGRAGHWEVPEVTESVQRFVDEANRIAGEEIVTISKVTGKGEYYRIAPNKEINNITGKLDKTWSKFEKEFSNDEMKIKFRNDTKARKIDIPEEHVETFKEARKLIGGMYDNMRKSASMKGVPVHESSYTHMAHVLDGGDMNKALPHYDEATNDIMNVVAKKRGLKYLDGRGLGRSIKMSIQDANEIVADNLFSTDVNHILEEAMRDTAYKSVNNMLADATIFNGDFRADFIFDNAKHVQDVFKTDQTFKKRFSLVTPEYLDNGKVDYRKINVNNTEELQKAFDEGSMIVVDKNTLAEIKTLKSFYGFNNKFLDDLREYGVGTYKSLWLTSVGFHLANVIDITVKNMVMNGKGVILSLPETVKNYWRSFKALERYDNIMKRFYDANKSPSMWNMESLNNFANNLSKDDRQIFDLVSGYKTSRAHSNTLINTTRSSERFRQDAGKGRIKKSLDYIKSDNPIIRTNFKLGETIEDVGRMSLWMAEQQKGKTNWEIINSVVDTHFDYANKSKWMYYGEFIIPFLTFPINNFKFWAEHGLDNFNIVHTIGRGQKALWQGAGYDYDNPDENVKYLRDSGAIPLTKDGKFLKTGSSLHSALGMVPPTNEMAQRLHPFIKTPLNLALAPEDSTYYKSYGNTGFYNYDKGKNTVYNPTYSKDEQEFNPLAYGIHQLNPFERQIQNFLNIWNKHSSGDLATQDLIPSVLKQDYSRK